MISSALNEFIGVLLHQQRRLIERDALKSLEKINKREILNAVEHKDEKYAAISKNEKEVRLGENEMDNLISLSKFVPSW